MITRQGTSFQIGEAIQTEHRLEDKVVWQRTCVSVVAYGESRVNEVFSREEEDTSLVYHSPYGIQQRTKTMVVRAVDMDVVVIFI